MRVPGSSLLRGVAVAFSTMLPFAAGCDLHKTKQTTVTDQTKQTPVVDQKQDSEHLKTYRLIIAFKDRPTKEQVEERLKPLFEYFETYSMEGPIGENVYIDFTTKLRDEDSKIMKLLYKMKEVNHAGYSSNIKE